MNNEKILTSPLAGVESNSSDQQRPGIILIVLTVLVVLISGTLSFIIVANQARDISTISGFVIGQVLFFPILIVGIFQIGKRFRNARSRTKIFFWTSVVVLFFHFGNLSSIVQRG